MDPSFADALATQITKELQHDRSITSDVLRLVEEGREQLKAREAHRIKREAAEAEREAEKRADAEARNLIRLRSAYNHAKSAVATAIPSELRPFIHYSDEEYIKPGVPEGFSPAKYHCQIRVAGLLPITVRVFNRGMHNWFVSPNFEVATLPKPTSQPTVIEALAASRDAWLAQQESEAASAADEEPIAATDHETAGV